MIWSFSDGTTVELGGSVEGATILAQQLRRDIESKPSVRIWAPPGGDVPLDVNDAAILDAWLQRALEWRNRVRRLKLTLKRPDGIPALPPPPWADQPHEPGTIY